MARAKVALQAGTLNAILWHQAVRRPRTIADRYRLSPRGRDVLAHLVS